jgi:peptidoglycan-N-acetylglucosamine deacetylase
MRNLRASILFVFAIAAGALVSVAAAWAGDCPGNPNAIGTSRVLVLEPGELTHVGVMQYPDSLPLADKEVVLTFDDGPLPPYSNQVLDILASQCIKATYFLVGEMAHYFPSTVRRIYEAGHSIGTHSEDHPPGFQKLPVEKLRWEIDQGIANVSKALGDPKDLAPFFRIPGLARTDVIQHELDSRSLVTFSSDTVADDWHRHIKPSDITSRAMSRLEKRGKGILLLHDIHKSTVAALPELLKELKEKGFHIVHVIPGEPPGRIETASEPTRSTTGSIAPWSDDRTDPNWPKVMAGQTAADVVLPAPDATSFDTDYRPWRRVMLADGAQGAGILAVASADTHWPDRPETATLSAEAELPAPSMQDIGLPLEGMQLVGEQLGLRPSLAATGADQTGTTASDAPTPY